jgi:tetratricopeptide (TPR) repeat protein
MVIQWADTEALNSLPRLIKSYIDPEDPSIAAHNILRLAHLLLLSNHLTAAHEIASGVFRLAKNLSETSENEVGLPLYTPNSLEIFWQEHQEILPRPEGAPKSSRGPFETYLAKEQWDKYRECTRTGWMLDRYGLAEPEDPSIWRDTDDPIMLAMCARLLAKTTTPGTYPSPDKMREALAAGQKLYAIPEIPLSEWLLNRPEKRQRQCWLLYRRLIVELAIRLGKFQTAADLLSQALRVDGFVNGGELGDFLMIPGVYNILPLLAQGGKESNPFFIPKADAEVMVKEIIDALELRAKHGRQWALDESKVGWRELLDRLAEGAFKTHPKEYRAMGVKTAKEILYDPATTEEIEEAQKKVGKLPDDFKEMVRMANGYEFLGTFYLANFLPCMANLIT